MGAIAADVRLAQLQADADACGGRALFDRLISEGKTPEAAAMYACQQAPGTRNTDRAFCQGQRQKMENLGPLVRTELLNQAKRAGINTNGRFYVGGLGKATDHAAWVTSADDVLTVCKARNYECDGVLSHKAIKKESAPKPEGGLAPDIVNRLARNAMAADPSLKERVRKNKHAAQELRESLVEKHTRRKRFKKSSRLLK